MMPAGRGPGAQVTRHCDGETACPLTWAPPRLLPAHRNRDQVASMLAGSLKPARGGVAGALFNDGRGKAA